MTSWTSFSFLFFSFLHVVSNLYVKDVHIDWNRFYEISFYAQTGEIVKFDFHLLWSRRVWTCDKWSWKRSYIFEYYFTDQNRNCVLLAFQFFPEYFSKLIWKDEHLAHKVTVWFFWLLQLQLELLAPKDGLPAWIMRISANILVLSVPLLPKSTICTKTNRNFVEAVM